MKRLGLKHIPGTRLSSDDSQRLTYWIAALGLLLTFALADAAVLTWSAGLVTAGQLIASILAYILIGFGILATAYAVGNTRAAALVRIQPVSIQPRGRRDD